tara:strand:- start:4531 stop:5664 length:1134 start_codon:yes stop_codon:yes gene_type:complete
MFRLTTLRLIAQVASFILALSLRSISNETLGTYALSLSVLSIISAVITYEGTFLVISRNIYPSNFYTNLKFNRFIWIFISLSILYIADLGPLISMCLIGFLLTLDFDYLINLITLGERAHGKDDVFKKYLTRKIIFIEFLFPLISALAIYLNIVTFVLFMYLLIFISINFFMLWIGYSRSKKNPIYKAIPSLKGTSTSFLKRGDSQLHRIVIGTLFGSAFLGAIYPAVLIGRAGSIIGNIWYTYYFNKSKQVILAGNKFLKYLPIAIVTFIITCIIYSYVSKWFFMTFFDWDVNLFIYGAFFIINLQFLYKTFIRSITTNTRRIVWYNFALLASLLIKILLAMIFNLEIVGWLLISINIDLIIFFSLQRFLTIKHVK